MVFYSGRQLVSMVWPLLFVLLVNLVLPSHAVPMRNHHLKRRNDDGPNKNLMYLNELGYTSTLSSGMIGALMDEETALNSAVTTFQKVWGLKQTGEIDEATLKLLSADRCGNSDEALFKKAHGRTKRFAVKSPWPINHLTWNVTGYSKKLTNKQVDEAMQAAFDLWQSTGRLTFARETVKRPELNIFFAEGEHGDRYPFQGPGRQLAHAFYPVHGGLHIDDSEPWVVRERDGKDIVHGVLHELGHSIGIDHSDNLDAIMYPYYQWQDKLFLYEDDINAVKFLYGEVITTTTPPKSPTERWCADLKLDSIFYTESGAVVFTKGLEMAKIDRYGIGAGFPVDMGAVFQGMVGPVDAALVLPTVYRCYSSKTQTTFYCLLYDYLFFKGANVFRYRNSRPINQKTIAETFPDIPDDLDSAFTTEDGKIYFTKGRLIYRLTRGVGVDEGFPKDISDEFRGLPDTLDAAFTYVIKLNDIPYYITYVFSGKDYYLLDFKAKAVNSRSKTPYPRPFGEWFLRCPSELDGLEDGGDPSFNTPNADDHSWDTEIAEFEPGTPRVQGYFDEKNRPLEMTDEEVDIPESEDDVTVEEEDMSDKVAKSDGDIDLEEVNEVVDDDSDYEEEETDADESTDDDSGALTTASHNVLLLQVLLIFAVAGVQITAV